MSKRDYHAVLGVSLGATAAEIKHAFRKRAHQLHPDHGGDAQKFAELKEAFEQAVLDAKLRSLSSMSTAYAGESAADTYSAPSGFNSKFYPSFLHSSSVDEIFADANYNQRRFFLPSHPNVEGLERAERAREKHCPICDGTGRVSKVMDPEAGFMSLETRLCQCQLMDPEELAL